MEVMNSLTVPVMKRGHSIRLSHLLKQTWVLIVGTAVIAVAVVVAAA